MSTGLRPTRLDRSGNEFGPQPAGPGSIGRTPRQRGGHARRRRRKLTSDPAWPLVFLLAGYPLWWALGVADYMFIVLAIPMAVRLYRWHAAGRRVVRLPPGFSIWVLFLICMLAGAATLTLTAPHTVITPTSSRALSYLDRSASYLSVTVILLFAGNLTEREFPRRRLAWLLGLVGIYAIIGGFGGIIMPRFQFTSPLAYVMPKRFQANTLVQAMIHPGLTQLQGVLGVEKGRPKAPFDYTDTWGQCLTILLPWLLVAWSATRKQFRMALAVVGLALVPLVYSLDRGAWIGACFVLCYLAVRFAARGKLAMLGGLCAALALGAILIVLTPLGSMISGRIAAHEHNSNSLRTSLSIIAVQDAAASPFIGYGDERHMQGSPTSIAVGPTANCISCGEAEVGSDGQFWLLLVCDGFVGTALYLGFFAYGIWRYRRDRTPYGMAGILVLLLSFVYMFFYDAVVAPLAFTMLAYALMWRNDHEAHLERDQAGELAAGTPPNAVPRYADGPARA
jgi:hypothetical protein